MPLGLVVGQAMPIGNQSVNIQLGTPDHVIRPDIGPEGQGRGQISCLFSEQTGMDGVPTASGQLPRASGLGNDGGLLLRRRLGEPF